MLCGYAFLADKCGSSRISLDETARLDTGVNRLVREGNALLVPARMAPASDDLFAHIAFAIKHEGMNLEILAQALPHVSEDQIEQAVEQRPTSALMRKIAWLWETFTRRELRHSSAKGQYAKLFCESEYFTGPEIRIPRWRVVYNGLGPIEYCPIVRKTKKLSDDGIAALFERLQRELNAIPSSLLARASNWAYLSETRSSFEIEREAPSGSKTERFIELLKKAGSFERLNEALLCDMQNQIVSSPFSEAFAYRSEQNWLANSSSRGVLRITYVPPPPEILDDLMSGLLAIANASPGSINPLIRAGVASFGFVFLHPFLDGNGRLSRFLIHQQLLRGKVIPQGALLPVSAAILEHEAEYLAALERFSVPCRKLWKVIQTGETEYDFLFLGHPAAYRYRDATAECEFLFDRIRESIERLIPEEIDFLEKYDRIYSALNERFDVVQKDLDLIVATAVASGRISQNLRKKLRFRVEDEVFDALDELLAKERTLSSEKTC